MTLNPNASEYIPIFQSTLELFYPSAIHVTPGFHVSLPSAALLIPSPFPCPQVHPQGLIQPPPCRTYFLPPSPLLPPPPPPPPPQRTDVEQTSHQSESIITFATKGRTELLFPKVITDKKFVPSYNNYPRSCRSSRVGFLSSGGKRCRRRPLMSVDSRGTKPKDKESCDLKKHSVLPLNHDEEKTTVMIKNIPYEFT